MKFTDILSQLNESTSMSEETLAEYNGIFRPMKPAVEAPLDEAPAAKFNVYVDVVQDENNTWFIFKKTFRAADENQAKAKATKELDKFYASSTDTTQIPGWTKVGETNDGTYHHDYEEPPYAIYQVKAWTGKLKKGQSPYQMDLATKATSQMIAEVLHGQQQSQWFRADLDGLAYNEGSSASEKALKLANKFAPIYYEGEDMYFVEAKVKEYDGDAYWIWTLAPKIEIEENMYDVGFAADLQSFL